MKEWDISVEATNIVQTEPLTFPVTTGTFQGSLVMCVADENGKPVVGLTAKNVQLCQLGGVGLVVPRPVVFLLEATAYTPSALPGYYVFEPDWNDLESGANSFVFGVTVTSHTGDRQGHTVVRIVRDAPVF